MVGDSPSHPSQVTISPPTLRTRQRSDLLSRSLKDRPFHGCVERGLRSRPLRCRWRNRFQTSVRPTQDTRKKTPRSASWGKSCCAWRVGFRCPRTSLPRAATYERSVHLSNSISIVDFTVYPTEPPCKNPVLPPLSPTLFLVWSQAPRPTLHMAASKVETGSIGRQCWKITLVKNLLSSSFLSFSLSMPADLSDLHVLSIVPFHRRGYIVR